MESTLNEIAKLNRKNKVVGNVKDNQDLYHLCVTASQDYILRVLTLYESLTAHSDRFKLWICCMDRRSFRFFRKLNKRHMVLFYVEQLENDQLKEIKQQRQMNEYCWTIKAPLIQHLLTTYDLESVLYCDGDLFFFSDPKEIFDEWGSASIYLTPQRDLDWVERRYGKYQAGMIGFKNDQEGLASVSWWAKQCQDWCFIEPSEDRFGDQKYLDRIPEKYSNVKISAHLGVNAAPWNCVYNNDFEIKRKDGEVYVDDNKLIAYHFACMAILNEDEYELWSLDTIKIKSNIKKEIYEPYIIKIREIIQTLKKTEATTSRLFNKKDRNLVKTYYKFTPFRQKMDQFKDFYCFSTIVSKEYLIKGLALHQSIKQNERAFHLWIYCMDQETLTTLVDLDLDNVTLISPSKIQTVNIRKKIEDRTLTEKSWTMKPFVCEYILNKYSEIDHLIYCDADMYFFSSPKTLFEEWSTYSIFLSKQRSTPEVEHLHGIYQAGLIGFKQEPNSRRILSWWKEQCLNWCYDDYSDSTRWGDQKYLNQIVHHFENIKVIDHIGIDAAPWNLVMKEDHKVKQHSNRLKIDDKPLICYHFGSLLMIDDSNYDLWKREKLSFSDDVIQKIYKPYIEHLRKIYKGLDNSGQYFSRTSKGYLPQNGFTIE